MDYSLKRKMQALKLYELGVQTTFDKINHAASSASEQTKGVDRSHMRLLETKIAGTSFIEDRSVFDSLQLGDIVFLDREPSNPYDPMAIVIIDPNGKKLGYIPKDDNTVIGNMLDAGKSIYALILDIVDHEKYLDIAIEVYMDDEVLP